MMIDDVADLVEKLDFEISNFEKVLEKLRNNLILIQDGNNGTSYWNGDLAYGWLKSALAHLDHDIVLDNNLRSCLDYLRENKQ